MESLVIFDPLAEGIFASQGEKARHLKTGILGIERDYFPHVACIPGLLI
jgi:hypothetical protein